MRTTPSHSPSTLVLLAGPQSSKGVGHFNDVLHRHGGLTSFLSEQVAPIGDVATVVPIIGDDDAGAVLAALEQAGEGDGWLPDQLYFDHTFTQASKGVGHGLAFVEITLGEEPDDTWPTLAPGLRRPVVALLDTGVRPHGWLPHPPDGDPFVIDAEQLGWRPDLIGGKLEAHDDAPAESKAGHGTFIAGIVRQAAPSARVLSVRVMNDDGVAAESQVCLALEWLLGYLGGGNPVDVICMAFGREPGDTSDQPLLRRMEQSLKALADKGVQIVASAGNDHQESKIYPAAFDTVTAVGAGFAGYHATFSNFGDWVDRFRDGVNVLSIMPGDKWARWTGTSFAAANFAADLARPRVA